MSEKQSSEYILEVRDLCQSFTSGHGKKRITVNAVDHVSFNIRPA